MNVDWELSQSFESDGQGIRAACVLEKNSDDDDDFFILTGTQSGSLVLYGVPSGSMTLVEYQHDHAVTALVSFYVQEKQQYYSTGCKDSMIRVFDASSHKLQHCLEGHEKAVTSLAFFEPNFLVSGSWDGTAKVWNLSTNALVCTLEGHENTVSVCVISSTATTATIATGSAGVAQGNQISGHSIRLHQINLQTGESRLLHKVSNDHDGPIRDVSFQSRLASCSNDGTVRLRSAESGETQATLMLIPSEQQQHPPMLLSVTELVSTDGATRIAASAEDGNVVVWDQQQDDDGTTQQTLLRHASCVWRLIALPNGDLGTCCQDGVLRIFTMAQERMASLEVRQAFCDLVQQALQKQTQGPSSQEIAKLPLWERNFAKQGKSEGQVQIFNKDGVAIAAQWSEASKTWIEVGQVMGNVGDSSDKNTIDGVKYDHVLPIEVDTSTSGDVAKLQIGYNNGENPFVAAQRFMDAHVLPQHHLAEIADYIRQRVGEAVPTLGEASAAPTVNPAALLQHLPAKGYKSFDMPAKNASGVLEKMTNKIVNECNPNYQQQQQVNQETLQDLTKTLLETNRYHSSSVSDQKLEVITTMLTHWSPAHAFPALDLARLTVLHPQAAASDRTSFWKQVLQLALNQYQKVSDADGTAAVATPMLTLRLFANCFRGGPGSLHAVTDQLDSALTCTESLISSKNKSVRLSVATVLLNTSSWLNSSSSLSDATTGGRIVSAVASILELKTYESEAMVRTLVALGTVLVNNPEAKSVAKSLFLGSKVEPAASPHGDKAKAVAKEIYTLLA